jgi:hypothetical protein
MIQAWFYEGYGEGHVQLCKRLAATAVVAVLLQQPSAFTGRGMPLAILTPVEAVPVWPGLPRVSLVGLLLGSGGPLVALPLGFASPLARRVRTAALGFAPRIGHKAAPTMGTAALAIQGFLLGEAVNLQQGLVQEE